MTLARSSYSTWCFVEMNRLEVKNDMYQRGWDELAISPIPDHEMLRSSVMSGRLDRFLFDLLCFCSQKSQSFIEQWDCARREKKLGTKTTKPADRITAAAAIHARHTRAHNDSTLRYCSWQLGMIYLFHNLVFIIRFINNLYQSVALPNNVSLEIPDWDGWKTYPTKIEKK